MLDAKLSIFTHNCVPTAIYHGMVRGNDEGE